MATLAQESALLIKVPTAEPAVAPYRSRLDWSAPLGVPAHITVLYPFLPPADIGAEVLASLSRLFASARRFSFVLYRTGWFGEQVLWLGPEEEGPFRALTQTAFAAFPSCPPYGGQFADVVPHLTVGDTGPLSELHAAAEAVRPHLPIAGEATEVTLMTGPSAGSAGGMPARPPAGLSAGPSWTTVAAFPLG
jgi:2'-5' RNA ligase